MKKIKHILIFIICFQITIPFVVEGSLKIPVLLVHFFHHNNHHEKINFTHFVSEHYSEKHHDENHDEHENLPFHKHSDTPKNEILTLIFFNSIYKIFDEIYFKEVEKIDYKQNHFKSNILLSIWKPPKISY